MCFYMVKIAVEGCMHGDLDNVYSTLRYLEKVENTKIDLLICCGDFQVCTASIILFSLVCSLRNGFHVAT